MCSSTEVINSRGLMIVHYEFQLRNLVITNSMHTRYLIACYIFFKNKSLNKTHETFFDG